MAEHKAKKSVEALCEEARMAVAQKLPEIVRAFAEQASGEEPSVVHAKFLMEILQLTPAGQKKTKMGADEQKKERNEESNKDRPSLGDVLIEALNELRVAPEEEPSAYTVK